MVQLQKLLINK